MGYPNFIDNDNILIEASDWPITKNYHLTWNIPNNKIKNFINFKNNYSVAEKDSLILLCNQLGVIGYLNKNIVPVKDLSQPNESILAYNNNQLEFYSDKSFTGESFIYDTTGKLIVDLGSKLFIDGKNTIPINKPLNIGLYILTIDTGSEKSSYKFIVE